MAENIDRRGDAQTPTTPAQGPSAVPQPALQNPVTYYSASPGPGAYQPPYQPPFGPSAPPAGQYGMGPGSGFEVQSITPSGCGCGGQGKGQKVYAIGELGIDFVSETRRDSLQDNFGALPIGDPYNLLGYLLGLTGVNSGNLYDAASIYWVLKQGECPLYVVQPQGSFAEAAYKQLIIFFIEQLVAPEAGKSLADALAKSGISTDCIKWFFPCYGGAQPDLDVKLPLDPSHTARGEKPASQGEYEGKAQKEEEPKPEDGYQSPIISAARALFNEDPSLAAHIAIAGEVTGRARLYSGEEVDVINPAMRGMQNWNTESLITKVMYELTHEPGPEPRKLKPLPPGLMKDRVMSMLFKLVASLYDAILNPGKDPRDRAKNYFATTQLFNATLTLTNPIFLSMLGAFGHRPDHPDAHDTINEQFAFIALDKLVATNARCVRYNTEPYDVELSFYNFANQFMGTAVLAKTVDVSDIVPVAPGDTRVFSRRG